MGGCSVNLLTCLYEICVLHEGTMIDGVMNQNAMGLAFGGGLKEMGKTGEEVYFFCAVYQ